MCVFVINFNIFGISLFQVPLRNVNGAGAPSTPRSGMDPRICDRSCDMEPRMLMQMAAKSPDFSQAREINHGSGSKAEVKNILKRLHASCSAAL